MRAEAFIIAFIVSVCGFLGTAVAAPQVLMVVTANDQLPLTCQNGICATEVAAICLQPERRNPARGKIYRLRDDTADVGSKRAKQGEDSMMLVGRDAAGREKILPATDVLRIRAERDHLAVTLSVDEAVLHAHSLVSLTVHISGNVLLFPEAEKDDARPQTLADIERAKTMLRETAKHILSKRSEKIAGAGVVQNAMNALPKDRATNEMERQSARRDALRRAVSPKALSYAEDAFYACRSVSDRAMIKDYDSRYGYRACLGIMHDDLIDGVNKEYWRALGAGS